MTYFICYKETDKDGRRTQDSVLANDLYHQLTQEGFKVFFARITLEDKLRHGIRAVYICRAEQRKGHGGHRHKA